MNAFLSILVCIAMLCSGTGAIPAQPETATTWTLRNLTISDGTDSVTLAPEARLTTAIGSDVARGHFEIVNGDDVLMPMSGELTADGVRFSLGKNGNVYSITNDTLMELLDMDEDGMQALECFASFYEGYATLLGRTMNDAEFQREVSAAALDALTKTCGVSTEDTEVELDGTAYPAQIQRLELTVASTLDLMDALANCGVKELEDMLRNYILMFSTLSGEDYDSFEAFTADLREEASELDEDFTIPVTMTTVEQDGVLYCAMDMDFEQDGAQMEINMVSMTVGEEINCDMSMVVSGGDDENTFRTAMTLSEQVFGPVNAPELVRMNMSMSSQSHSAYEFEGDDFKSNSDTSMTLTMNVAAMGDGLGRANMKMGVTQNYDHTSGNYISYANASAVNLTLTGEDRLEEDGSVTTPFAINIDTGDHKLDISFDINRAEGAPVDYFEGAQVRELTADTSDAAYGQLVTEVLSIAADAATLAADDSVIAMTRFLGVPEEELYDEDDEDYDDEDYEDYDITTVSSFEEAAEIYEGELPDYIAPEGFVLEEIQVDPIYYYAYYTSEAQDRTFYIYGLDGIGDDSAGYAMMDGALRPADGTVNVSVNDGVAVFADAVIDGCRLSFYFNGDFSLEEAEAIISGLKF